MTSKGLIKRFLPFFATFAAGLFIASFFVSVTGPFAMMSERRFKVFDESQKLQLENLQLRDRNAQLEEQIEQLRRNPINLKHTERDEWNSREHELPLESPKAPRAPRHIR